jgi:hypothetical protein
MTLIRHPVVFWCSFSLLLFGLVTAVNAHTVVVPGDDRTKFLVASFGCCVISKFIDIAYDEIREHFLAICKAVLWLIIRFWPLPIVWHLTDSLELAVLCEVGWLILRYWWSKGAVQTPDDPLSPPLPLAARSL